MMLEDATAERCRQRAIEARDLAAQQTNSGSRANWLQIAQRWEQMADHAEAKEQARAKLNAR